MAPYKKIMVTLDGSVLAERALAPAVSMAQAEGTQLVLLRVVTPVYLWAPFVGIEPAFEVVEERNEEEVSHYLEEVRQRLSREYPTVKISTEVLHGPVAEAIVDYAAENDVDLIVISSHGRSGLGRWVYGSVAEKVLRGARCCSTLVVRGELQDEAGLVMQAKKASPVV